MPEDAKVHVGNLSFDTREDDLRFEFENYGRVEHGRQENSAASLEASLVLCAPFTNRSSVIVEISMM